MLWRLLYKKTHFSPGSYEEQLPRDICHPEISSLLQGCGWLGWGEDGEVDFGLVGGVDASLSEILNPTGAPGAAAVLGIPKGGTQLHELHTEPALILGFAPAISYLPRFFWWNFWSRRKSNSGKWKAASSLFEANNENSCLPTLWFAEYLIKEL